MPRSVRAAPSWLLELVACPQPGCRARVRSGRGRSAGVLGCAGCGMLYPVLAGVPLLVPAPHAYCAAHREALVTALAEASAFDPAALALIDAFAASAPGTEAQRFGDDWTGPGAAAGWPRRRGAELARFDAFVAAAGPLERRLAALVRRSSGVLLDLGCGDGELVRRLAGRASRRVVADLSLRAVLRARAACGGADVAGAVLDADQPALADGAFAVVTCANLVDLLDHPLALPAALAAALAPGGQLVMSSPDPELGADDAAPLLAAFERAGLRVERVVDGLPWLRLHPPRHAQVYVCLAVVATRPAPGRPIRRRVARSRTRRAARASPATS